MLLCKELESSGLVRLDAGDIQNSCGEGGNLRIVRVRHLLKAGHVLLGDARLPKESKDVVFVFNGLSLTLWPGLAVLAYVDFVTFSGKLLVRTFVPANPAVVSHPGSFQQLRIR